MYDVQMAMSEYGCHSMSLLQATLASTTKQRDCPWPLRIELDDEFQVAKAAIEVDQRCVEHIRMSMDMTRNMVNVGMAMDKASVRGLQLSNGLIALPNNQAMELMPQVVCFCCAMCM